MTSSLSLHNAASDDVSRLLAGITEDIERDGFAFRSR